MKRRIIALVSSLAVLLAVLLTGCGGTQTAKVSTADTGVLTLRVNPEIAIAYDKDGLVSDVTGLNADGQQIVASYTDYIGKTCDTVLQELVEGVGLVSVLGREFLEGRGQGHVRHGEAAALYGGLVVVHEVDLVVVALAACDVEGDFEPVQRFEHDVGLQVVGAVVYGRAYERRVLGHEPVVLDGMVDVVAAHGGEGKSQPRRHGAVTGRLAEHVAN